NATVDDCQCSPVSDAAAGAAATGRSEANQVVSDSAVSDRQRPVVVNAAAVPLIGDVVSHNTIVDGQNCLAIEDAGAARLEGMAAADGEAFYYDGVARHDKKDLEE